MPNSSGISSSPAMSFYDKQNSVTSVDGVYIEEIPSYSGGIETIDVINSGYGYTSNPTVNIIGDGSGANAYAVIVNGGVQSIIVTETGANYTQAIVEIVDGGGVMAKAVCNVQGRYGSIKTFYFNKDNIKTNFDSNVGTVDYDTGIVTLSNFNPKNVNNPLGQLTISVKPKSNILYSTRNRILSVDPYDPSAIIVNVIAKV